MYKIIARPRRRRRRRGSAIEKNRVRRAVCLEFEMKSSVATRCCRRRRRRPSSSSMVSTFDEWQTELRGGGSEGPSFTAAVAA